MFVGLLVYLCSWLDEVGRKSFNTVVGMDGTPDTLSFSRAFGKLGKAWRKLQCTDSLRWKNRVEEDAMLDSFKFCFLCSKTPASPGCATPLLGRDASDRHGKGMSSATSPILGLRKFSH